MTREQIVGLAACGAMGLSVFMPIVESLRLSFSTMSANPMAAGVQLFLAAATALGMYFERKIVSVIFALLNLLLISVRLFNWVGTLSGANTFSSASLSWGWLIMLVAGLVMAVTSFRTRKRSSVTE